MNPEKQCRAQCKRILPLTAFGKNRKYKSGRHNYCRECCTEKMKLSRQGLLPNKPKNIGSRTGHPLFDVLTVIRKGARTKKQISDRTGLSWSAIDMVMIELIVERKQVVTRAVGWEQREYFPRRVA